MTQIDIGSTLSNVTSVGGAPVAETTGATCPFATKSVASAAPAMKGVRRKKGVTIREEALNRAETDRVVQVMFMTRGK
jgi:hypothetical protein